MVSLVNKHRKYQLFCWPKWSVLESLFRTTVLGSCYSKCRCWVVLCYKHLLGWRKSRLSAHPLHLKEAPRWLMCMWKFEKPHFADFGIWYFSSWSLHCIGWKWLHFKGECWACLADIQSFRTALQAHLVSGLLVKERKEGRTELMHHICCFLWYIYSSHGLIQATTG